MLVSLQIMVLVGVLLVACVLFWIPGRPHDIPPAWHGTNVWVTLMHQLNQSSFCVSLAQPYQPFHTCLIGVPLNDSEAHLLVAQRGIGGSSVTKKCNGSMQSCTLRFFDWATKLPKGREPEELEILGTLTARSCLYVNSTGWHASNGLPLRVNSDTEVSDISPLSPFWQNASQWCQHVAGNKSHSVTGIGSASRLPKGLFLLCGDRAWAGIPTRAGGGPCTFGRLAMMTPPMKMLLNHSDLHTFSQGRVKRSATLLKNCNSNVQLWNTAERIFASIFAPGVAVANALTTLNKMACWIAKNANLTSEVLSQLANDVNSIRHATLQNRAAIDFLLLAHGHGCEEFDGMCCMNLEDHSESIHKKIQDLQVMTRQIQEDTGFFGIEKLFGQWGLSRSLMSLVETGFLIVLVVVIVLLMLPCLITLMRRALHQTVEAAFVAQKQKGGIVGDGSWTAGNLALVEDIDLDKFPVYP